MTATEDTSGITPDEQARAASAAMHAGDAVAALLGIEVVAVGPGRATTRLVVGDDMVNGHGSCHGGIIFTLADSAFGHACNSHGPETVAVAATIDFVSPGRRGATLTAEAVEQHRRGRSGLYDVTVTADDGELVARFHGRAHQLRA